MKAQNKTTPLSIRAIRGAGNFANALSMLGVKILVAWAVWQGLKIAFNH
jgi:hypothetical protein